MTKRLTVFTPTYNREKLLKRVYDSLVRQTNKDFLWLIIDDGSSDNTKEVVESFISEGLIEIEYRYCDNGGKMRAHNRATENLSTELFICVDSDDYLVDNAVEKLLNRWDEESDLKKSLAGIISHKGKSETTLLSDVEFPDGIRYSGLYSLYLKGFKGETTIMFKSEVIKAFPFPEIEGEKYVPEDYIYDKIDREYEYIVFPEIITICEIVENGYTDSVKKLKLENKNAFYLYYKQRAEITPFSILKIKYLGFFAKYAKLTKRPLNEIKTGKAWLPIAVMASLLIKE